MTAGCAAAAAACFTICFALSACTRVESTPPASIATGGNSHRGKQLISNYGCGACHIIPGIRTANGLVGPPLYDWGDRTIIAGELANTPDNLVRWLENPKAIEPQNAMPDLGLSKEQATDIAAYLYTLRRGAESD